MRSLTSVSGRAAAPRDGRSREVTSMDAALGALEIDRDRMLEMGADALRAVSLFGH